MTQSGHSRIQVWLLAARPKTLPAAVAPVLIGSAMAQAVGGFDILPALAALLGAVMIQIGTNFANDYFDFKKGADEGERLGPLRATQAGLVAPGKMKLATILAFVMATLCGVYLVIHAGWPIVVIGLLSILFGVMYTGGPFPLGYHGLGEIFVLIFFGPVAVGGTYYVQTLNIDSIVIIAGFAPGLLSVAILAVNNLRDIEGDRLVGKRTLAARFGIGFARTEFVLSIVVASAMPVLLHFLMRQHPWAMLTLVLLPLSIPVVGKLFVSEGRELNKVLAATGQLLVSYSLLFSIGWML